MKKSFKRLEKTVNNSLFNISVRHKQNKAKNNAFKCLYNNDYGRFLNNSKHLGLALIEKNKRGELSYQFDDVAEFYNSSGYKINYLHDIKKHQKNGNTIYTARTKDNKKLKAKRFLKINVSNIKKELDTNYEFACFSPEYDNEYWGGKKENIEIFNNSKSIKNIDNFKQPLKAKDFFLQNISKQQEFLKVAGECIPVTKEDIKKRLKKKRNPSQNEVMGKLLGRKYLSATNYTKWFVDNYHSILSKDMIKFLSKAINRKLGSNLKNEWLHLYAYSLCGLYLNPQIKSNLGAASKLNNTEMMILEKVASFFVLNSKSDDLKVMVGGNFKTILDTNLLKEIDFKVKLSKNDNQVTINQHIPCLQKDRLAPKGADKFLLWFAVNNLLHSNKKDIAATPVDTNAGDKEYKPKLGKNRIY